VNAVVTIRVGNDRATFDGARWSGQDGRLVRALELLTPEISPSVGRPDVYVANAVLARLTDQDAEIVDVSPSSDADAGVVYGGPS
jgi:hypothetical protein